MQKLSSVAYVTMPADMDYSHITDLALVTVDGVDVLYATTRLDGGLTAWALDDAGPVQIDSLAYDSFATAGGDPHITVMNDALLTLGGARQPALRTLNADGTINDPTDLGTPSTFAGSLGQTATITTDQGITYVYGQITGANGIARMAVSDTGSLITAGTTSATPLGAITTVSIGDMSYVISAGATDNTLTTWAVGATTGGLSARDSLTPDDGLWINAPTAVDTAFVDGDTYVLLASAGSDSITVMQMDAAGDLTITDHLLDSRDSRFGGVTSLTVVDAGGHTYVVVGGADDGISLYQLVAGGRLIARAHLADTTTTGLANVSAITATGDATGITIFVASSAETGITQLRFDAGPTGITQTAAATGGLMNGTDDFDMLIGGAGVDKIKGRDGDDIIYDGEGRDVLTGGAGADVFVLAYDKTDDLIMDFTPGEDKLDLSSWDGLRSLNQLFISQSNLGLRITYGDETLLLISNDAAPLTADMLQYDDLLGTNRLPQTVTGGFAGPVVVPDLPEQPVIPIVEKPPMVDPTGREIQGTSANNALNGGDMGDRIWGFSGDDALNGFNGDDQLLGGSGADALYGGNGNDILLGGSGRDTAWANDARTMTQDVLSGGAGDDQLFGQSGADRLAGDTGNDMLTGGAGRDTFIFTQGRDTVTDFSTMVDDLEIDNALWTGTKSADTIVDTYASVRGGDVVFDFGANNTLTLQDVGTTDGLADLINIV